MFKYTVKPDADRKGHGRNYGSPSPSTSSSAGGQDIYAHITPYAAVHNNNDFGSMNSPGPQTALAKSPSSSNGYYKAGASPPAAQPTGQQQVMLLPPEMIRKKLEKVLSDKDTFVRSAKVSFKQFDKDHSGTLDFNEVRELIARLCQNLQLPPVDDHTLAQIFMSYDMKGQQHLTLEEFAQLYWRLLLRVREKYYPVRTMKVRRSFFVGRTYVDKNNDIRELFKFTKFLGRGSFGEAHLVIERSSGLKRVCKIINKDRKSKELPPEQIETEINVLKSLDHPNIIKIFEVYEDYNNIYIIMEVCEGGELIGGVLKTHEMANSLDEAFVARVMSMLLSAITYIHSNKIAHKDLKPENILFQDSSPNSPLKVIDFGLSELFENEDEYSVKAAGTAYYMAPEVLKKHLGLKCDVWSAGCIMYQMLTGKVPFGGGQYSKVVDKILKKEPAYETEAAHVSSSAIDLIQKMLKKDQRVRITAQEALNHPWFHGRVVKPNVGLSREICENMKKYMKQSGLKNALVNLMAHQLNVSGSQIAQINDVFKSLDEDNNGTLSPAELARGLAAVGIQNFDIIRIIQALDVDDSGNISYTEFLAACYSWRESELNIVWTAFNKMDRDGDGKITVDEFAQVLCGGAEAQTTNQSRLVRKNEVSELVKLIDRNGDGVIDWDEFLAYLRNTGG